MLTLRKILVPSDFSQTSARALTEAHYFASTFGASIDLLHVWSPPAVAAPESVLTGVGLTEQPLLQWLGGNASELLEKQAADARNSGMSIGETFCDMGDAASVIIERALRGGYDLLVLGTHGRSGLSHLLLGSVAEKVVRRAPCPVLTIRAEDPPKSV